MPTSTRPATPSRLLGACARPAANAAPAVRSVTARAASQRLVRGQPTSDGAGVKLTRVLDAARCSNAGPVPDARPSSALDDPSSDYIGGFPDHPHRGFETVTVHEGRPHEAPRQRGQHGLLGPAARSG
jgi:redox-sensitive bicupin YhaK (pirin superfamily)